MGIESAVYEGSLARATPAPSRGNVWKGIASCDNAGPVGPDRRTHEGMHAYDS